MKKYSWYKDVLKRQENDLDYILEAKKIDITESICNIMEESNINRKQLADKMETSPAAITKFLNGDANFTLKTLIKFSICPERDLVFSFAGKRKIRTSPYDFFAQGQRFSEEQQHNILKNEPNRANWFSAVDSGTPSPGNYNFNRADSDVFENKWTI